MASIVENYSVAWSGHANNCSVSFAKLLQRMDMADVTLVANGVKFKAHRFVLCTLSPYFDDLFAGMPFNERAFVILKDVTQQTLHDLITFIYHGDVKVKHANLEDFFKTGKSLKIKGLTDAESQLSNNFNGPVPAHTSSTMQFQTIESPEKMSSSDNSQSAQPVIKNNLELEDHANDIVQIKMENGEVDRQLATNGTNNYSNSTAKTMEIVKHLAVKRESPSQSSHIDDIAPNAKRTKRLNVNDLVEYNIVADLRTNLTNSRENLFYAENKFTKMGKKTGIGKQRWVCSKAKCSAAMSTLEIGGITMMKVLIGGHSH